MIEKNMSRRQKLCLVLPSHWARNFGGAEYQVSLLLEELLEYQNLDVVYLARSVSDEFADSRYTIKKIKPVPFLSKLGFWVDAISLLKHLYSEKPDTIYQRVGCAYTGICAFYAKRTGCRLIWHISIDSDLSNDIGRFPLGSRFIERKIRDFGIHRADMIIAQTDDQARILAERYEEHAQVVRNFQPGPTQVERKAKKPRVIWVANLKPAKRPEAYLDVVKLTSKSLDVDFVMVGRGGDNDAYANMIEEASQTSGLDYVGAKPIEEVNDLISSAHILVNTSNDEGFPNTFIQAWYRRTVVVSMGIDPDNMLKENTCGVVCTSVNEVVQAIEELIQDDKFRLELSERAFDYVTDVHSMKNVRSLATMLVGKE